MIVATAYGTSAEGKDHQVMMLGLSKANVQRLEQGQPIDVSRQTHGMGVPENLSIVIFMGDTEQEILAMFRKNGLIGPETVVGQKRPG